MEYKSANIDMRSNPKLHPFYKQRNQIVEIENKSLEKNEKFIVKIFDKIIGLAIMMLFFGFPLYFTNLTLQGIIFEKQMFFYFWLLLGLVFWIAKSVVNGEMNIRRTPLDIPILGFWLVYMLATFFSVDRWHSFWGAFLDPSKGFVGISAYIIAYYFIFSNFNLKRLKFIFGAMIVSGMGLIIWTGLAVFGANFLPKNLVPYTSVNLTGSITVMGIIFCYLVPIFMTAILKVADLRVRKIQKVFILSILGLFLLLDLFLIFVFHSYVLWIGFFGGLIIFLIFILTKLVRPNIHWVWLPMVIFMASIVTFKLADVFPMNQVNLPIEVHLNYQASKVIAIESVKNKAIIGSGPATYGYDFSMYRPKAFNLENFYNLRFFQGTGLLAEMLSTVGILGVFLMLIIVLSFIGSQIYLLVKDRENNKLYSLGFFSASVILLINTLLIRADGVALNLTIIISTLSLAVLLSESKNEKNNWNFSLKSSPKFALALAFIFITISTGVVFIFIYLGQIYIADMYAQKASRIASSDLEKAIVYLEKTIKLNNRESKYYVQMGQYYMGLANKEALKEKDARDINNIQKYLNNSVLATTKAKDMSRNNVEMVESLALIYENAGLYIPESLTLAEENYKRAQELEPYNAVYSLKLGQIKISMAQSETDADKKKQKVVEAKDLFQKAVEKKNNYAEGYYQLALTNEALSELDQAIENIKKAAQFNPKDIDYLLFLGRIYQSRNTNDDLKLAESYYKKAISMSSNNVNAHFYLGLLYEKMEKKTEAMGEYNKVISLLKSVQESESNKDTITKLQKMIENIDKGIKNTPESLGLVQKESIQQEDVNSEIQPVLPVDNKEENPNTNPTGLGE